LWFPLRTPEIEPRDAFAAAARGVALVDGENGLCGVRSLIALRALEGETVTGSLCRALVRSVRLIEPTTVNAPWSPLNAMVAGSHAARPLVPIGRSARVRGCRRSVAARATIWVDYLGCVSGSPPRLASTNGTADVGSSPAGASEPLDFDALLQRLSGYALKYVLAEAFQALELGRMLFRIDETPGGQMMSYYAISSDGAAALKRGDVAEVLERRLPD